jgi:hypothetical protein
MLLQCGAVLPANTIAPEIYKSASIFAARLRCGFYAFYTQTYIPFVTGIFHLLRAMDQSPRDRVFIGHGINRNRTNAWARCSSSRSPRSPPLEVQPSLYSLLSNSPRKRIRFGPNMERRQERTIIWPVCCCQSRLMAQR